MKDVYANDPEKQAQLDALREQADALGINYHHRAGIPKLEELIAAHQAGPAPEAPVAEPVQSDEAVAEKVSKRQYSEAERRRIMSYAMTKEDLLKELRMTPKEEANRLIRCRIQCMNPIKREWPGEIISVGNTQLGTFKKYIPYNNEPYHVPKIILDALKERECTTFVTVTDQRGNKTKKAKLIKEFAIEELPPLTQDELKRLAQRQAMAAGTADAMEEI